MAARSSNDPMMFHGVTVDDMPGKDALTRGLNFSLFRRGKLPGYRSCKGLFGEALKGEFLRINAGQRAKSQIAGARRVAAARERARAKLPPAEPVCAPGGVNPGEDMGVRDGPRGGP